MNDRLAGITASLVIHATCLSLILLRPAVVTPPVKTFQISFERQAALLDPAPGAAVPLSPDVTPPAQVKNAKQQEIVATKQKHSDLSQQMTNQIAELDSGKGGSAISSVKEELPVPVAALKQGNNMTGRSSLVRNTGNAAVVETRFGDRDAPQFIHRELPIYPKLARRLEKEGKVVLRLFIDPVGKVLNIDVIEHGAYGFTEAAIAAIKKSSFAPARRKGENVASRAILPIRFTLE
jgi:TonB family protein